ncbi:hypothetical protein K402DRAFT_296602, partial [Aulographum hederae CBS 113979]
VVYPPTGRQQAYVEFSDLERLDDEEFLNDNLIMFYIRWAMENVHARSKDALDKRIHIFNTFFYSKLTGGKRGGIDYSAVSKWTSKVDIFDKDYVVVPINE